MRPCPFLGVCARHTTFALCSAPGAQQGLIISSHHIVPRLGLTCAQTCIRLHCTVLYCPVLHFAVLQELRYQSSLDLSEEAYNAIRHLPLAKDLQQTARQQLVSRLEHYCQQQRPLFGRVLDLLQSEVLPLLQQGALAGAAEWVSQESLLSQHPVCVDMLLDVLADRGFKSTYCKEALMVPVAVDAATGNVTVRTQPQHR